MSCPPTSHTVKLMFLYSTVSTLNPARSNSGGKLRHAGPRTPSQGAPMGRGPCPVPPQPLALLTYGGDGGDDLPQLQLVEDGGLPSGVQPHHQDPHLLLPNEALQQVPEDVAHGDGGVGSVRRRGRILRGHTAGIGGGPPKHGMEGGRAQASGTPMCGIEPWGHGAAPHMKGPCWGCPPRAAPTGARPRLHWRKLRHGPRHLLGGGSHNRTPQTSTLPALQPSRSAAGTSRP